MRLEGTRYSVEIRDLKGRQLRGSQLGKARSYEFYKGTIHVDSGWFASTAGIGAKREVLRQRLELLLLKDELADLKQLEKLQEQEVRRKQDHLAAIKKHKKKYSKALKKKVEQELDDTDKRFRRTQKTRKKVEKKALTPAVAVTREVTETERKKKVFSMLRERNLNLVVKEFTHAPVATKIEELQLTLKRMQKFYSDEVAKMFKKPGKKVKGDPLSDTRRYLFRLLYSYKHKKQGVITRGAGGVSKFMQTDKESKSLVKDSLATAVRRLYSEKNSYFKGGLIPNSISLTGFTVEYVDTMGPRLKGEKLEIREREWEKAKREMMKRKMRTRAQSAAEQEERLEEPVARSPKRKKSRGSFKF